MLAFLMDHHIRSEITAGLIARGVDVITALADGSARFDDELLLERATSLNRVLVTQDRDFLRIVATWQASRQQHAGVIMASRQDADVGGVIGWLELLAQVLAPNEIRNRVEFIPARR